MLQYRFRRKIQMQEFKWTYASKIETTATASNTFEDDDIK